jgi:hypothetical protein
VKKSSHPAVVISVNELTDPALKGKTNGLATATVSLTVNTVEQSTGLSVYVTSHPLLSLPEKTVIAGSINSYYNYDVIV